MDSQPKHQADYTKQKRKRLSPSDCALDSAYASISFQARESSGRPGSPHRFFSSSYATSIPASDRPHNDNVDLEKPDSNLPSLSQVVHRHANGLCIVTAGEKIPDTLRSIEFVVSESPDCSVAEKRKRQAKMLRGSKVEEAVRPSTIIGYLKLEHGAAVPLYACVWGVILEINRELTPEVLQTDPLLDGYLAVILPSGVFPPSRSSDAIKQNESNQSK